MPTSRSPDLPDAPPRVPAFDAEPTARFVCIPVTEEEVEFAFHYSSEIGMFIARATLPNYDGRAYEVTAAGYPSPWHAIGAVIRDYLRDQFAAVITGRTKGAE